MAKPRNQFKITVPGHPGRLTVTKARKNLHRAEVMVLTLDEEGKNTLAREYVPIQVTTGTLGTKCALRSYDGFSTLGEALKDKVDQTAQFMGDNRQIILK